MSSDPSRPNRPAASATVVVAWLATLLLPACATGPAAGPFLLHPLPVETSGYSLAAGALLYEDDSLSVRMMPLDPSFVDRVVRESGRPNPFPSGPGAPPLLLFELTMNSQGVQSVYFNPANVRGKDDEGERYLPLSFTDFYQYHRDAPDRDALLAAFEDLALDKPLELRLGERATGYLVLSAPSAIPSRVTIELPFLVEGRQSRTVSLDFEAFPAAPPSE